MANVEGKATAITVLSPMKWWGAPWLWLIFLAARNIPTMLTDPAQELSFIHYAHWAVIRGFPREGEDERLGHSYLLFESNFNGTWDQYIDAFSETVGKKMNGIWGSSFGYPGSLPVEPFKNYIRKNEYVANHYWSAYPGATTTEIISAGRVEAALKDFRRRAEGLDPEAFKSAYESFLTGLQSDL